MAKYVLLSFDDDKDADNFVQMFNQHTVAYPHKVSQVEGSTEYQMGYNPSTSFVRGVYKKPTKFHDPTVCKAGKQVGFTRGTKYGWMVCAACGKPTAGWAKGDSWYGAIGRNLLDVSPQAPEYRGIGRPGHFWNEETKRWEPYIEATPDILPALNAKENNSAA